MRTARFLGILVFCVLVVPAISLVAYSAEHTFSVAPVELQIDVPVDGSVTEQFTIAPDLGDFSYPSAYNVGLATANDDHCREWNEEYTACIGGYDFDAWADDGLLCEYVELAYEDGEDSRLQVPDDAEDAVTLTVVVPCVEEQCANQHSWPPPFPRALLDRELVCDVSVREPIGVSYLAPLRAYAQSVTSDTLRVRAVVRENALGEATLALPTEQGYEGARGVVSSGPNPERGRADMDIFTFKVVYTHGDDVAPDSVEVLVANTVIPMQVDTNASDSVLRDGRYDNGEQYVATSTIPRGAHTYKFLARVEESEVRLTEREDATLLTLTSGYSSIAFLPGLQASRLFEDGLLFENKLWEPNRDADARSLVMNDDGTSANPDIYTKPGVAGALDEAFGFTSNIYKSFLGDLETWRDDDGIIAEYAVLPYDWRLAFDTVLGGGKVEDGKLYYDPSYAKDTPYIFSELERLVEGSDSGRVALVGHSMGGLVIKKMLTDLEDNPTHPYRDLLGKIDVVMLVASPQLGTPKAVASFLHGYGQELDIPPFGIPNFATDDTLRTIGRDMPSGYTLIPSNMYFDRVRDVGKDGVELPSTTILKGRGAIPVDSYQEMRDYFATDFGNAENDITVPLQPRSDYLDHAKVLHDRIDDWYPPDLNGDGSPDFRVVQIAGWGIKDTLSGVEYVNRKRRAPCPPNITGTCYENYLNPEPVMTHDGDGTVVVPSAVAMGVTSDTARGVETWYVDMYQYNEDALTSRSHASILEIEDFRTAIASALMRGNVEGDYLHTTTEHLDVPDRFLRLAMHSPVDVTVHDSMGNVVGAREEDGVIYYDEEIPNSYYLTFSESKYIGVPVRDEMYTIALAGTGQGTFTFELVEEENGKVLRTRTFTDVPVTPLLRGELSLDELADVETLELDTNGDGTIDATVQADELVQPPATFTQLITDINALTSRAKPALIATARIAERFAEHGKNRLAVATLKVLRGQVQLYASPRSPANVRIERGDAERITARIDALILALK